MKLEQLKRQRDAKNKRYETMMSAAKKLREQKRTARAPASGDSPRKRQLKKAVKHLLKMKRPSAREALR